MQEFWQAHNQISSIMFLKELIKSNVNTDRKCENDKKCEVFRIKYKYCDCFLGYANFKNKLIEWKYLCCNENYVKKFDEKLKCLIHNMCYFIFKLLINKNFLTTITISLFYCCKKVFTLMNIWVIGRKNQ